MGSAKVTIKQQDRSAIVPALSGISIATVVNSDWGPITPYLVTQPKYLESVYGTPNISKGSSWHGANLLLAQSSSVYVTRAIHDDAKYAASLIRFKTVPVDFNAFPGPSLKVDPIVEPLSNGLSLDGLDKYVFPQYPTTRTFESTGITVVSNNGSGEVLVSSLTKTDGSQLQIGDTVGFGSSLTDQSSVYPISEVQTISKLEDRVTIASPLSGSTGDEVFDMSTGSAVAFVPAVYLVQDANNVTTLLVTDSDNIHNGAEISINKSSKAVVSTKDPITLEQYMLTFDSNVTAAVSDPVMLMTRDKLEYRDACLVSAIYPGAMGDKIKVATRSSQSYPDFAFFIDVYFDGIQVESFEVTRERFVDGYGNQMYLEDKINGTSQYIVVKDNSMDESKSIPHQVYYGVWQQVPKDVFQESSVTAQEDILQGNTVVKVSSTSTPTTAVGARIKFGSADSAEYKITYVNGSASTITLDRPIVELKINNGTKLFWFDASVDDHSNGIYQGILYYKPTQIQPRPDLDIGDSLTIGDNVGKILDAGCNSLDGGSDGSAITVYDVIDAFKKMSNKEKYDISCWCENSFCYPEVLIAIDEINRRNGNSHGFGSSPYTEEIKADFMTAIKQYRVSLNLNTEYTSLFSGWVRVTDTFNQTSVWVAPSVFAVNAQSFVTRDYQIFTPAAGWIRGVLNGLEVTQIFDEGMRDALINSQINPIRYKEGTGFAIWGNETLYTKPSPLQLRSVAMLLIVLKNGLNKKLEFDLFDANDETKWQTTKTAISTFIRDELKNKGGVYDYQVVIDPTPTDIDNRRMPIFVGIQPTMDIKEIPVTLGVFNKSLEITV